MFLAVFCTLLFKEVFGRVDYCTAPLCDKGVVHVACNPNKAFQEACDANAVQINLDGPLKQLIVDQHNARRSQVATGNLKGFPTASKMTEMTWDDELAYIAGFNARQCVMRHDACRSTAAYPYSGQNLASYGVSNRFASAEFIAREAINNWWFGEYKDCPPELVQKLRPISGKQILHFTEMIQQKNGKVGCAVTQYTSGIFHMTLLACNYQYTNVINEEIYSVGQPCSKCPGKCSVKNPGLCV